MRTTALVLVMLALGCGSPGDAPAAPTTVAAPVPQPAIAQPAPAPPPTAPVVPPAPPQPTCVADVRAHALAEAASLYGVSAAELAPEVTPFPAIATGPRVDLDGDGQPETDVTFPSQYGAYSRRHWVYGSAGGCARALGSFEESYLFVSTARHEGLLDLLLFTGDDGLPQGAGTMTRLAFDGARYAPRETIACPSVDTAGRDDRCPGRDGAPGRWAQTGAWDEGAPACADPASDAAARFEGAEVEAVTLPDIDGDGRADVAYTSPDAGGNTAMELEVYLSQSGCARRAGRMSAMDTPTWDATQRELRGGWIETPPGACGPGDTGSVVVFYRLEGSALVESRRVSCPCEGGPPECQ